MRPSSGFIPGSIGAERPHPNEAGAPRGVRAPYRFPATGPTRIMKGGR
jgi:hypothetical protein